MKLKSIWERVYKALKPTIIADEVLLKSTDGITLHVNLNEYSLNIH